MQALWLQLDSSVNRYLSNCYVRYQRIVKMKKIAFLILCIATAATAGLFDKDTKVKIYTFCDKNNEIKKDDFVLWSFKVDRNSVIQKQEIYVDKILKQSDLKRLDNCLVVDKANWKCSEKDFSTPNGEVYKGSFNQVVNGKFTHGAPTSNGKPSYKPSCKIEQLN
jgi:hypothetical protein